MKGMILGWISENLIITLIIGLIALLIFIAVSLAFVGDPEVIESIAESFGSLF